MPARQAALAKRNATRRARLKGKSKPGEAISPEYLSRAIGGHAEPVERPEELPGALARARDAVTNDGRQALVNVICPY